MEAAMSYCPPNVTIWDPIWSEHGFSHCFMDTVSSSVIAGFMIIFGTIQLIMYKKYATDYSQFVEKSYLYNFQMFLLVFVPTLAIVRFILQATYYEHHTVYGYMIVYLVLMLFSFFYGTLLVIKERYYRLPSLPPRGHGIILLIFFTLLFCQNCLVIMNMNNKYWWFQLKTKEDNIEFTFFLIRSVSSLFLFVLGINAPGIDDRIIREDQIPIVQEQENQENRSTWTNAWSRTKKLLPFLWPKKDCLLQLRVIFCFLLLMAGRVINLYVPIYNKKIVDSLSEVPRDFRWDWILIYVGFKFLQGGGTGSMGLLNNLRSFMWIRVQQYTTREIEVELFRHLHSLSLKWHLGRKTGEVLRIMDRGTDSINNLLNYILFSITPTIVDILVAIIFFITAFNWWFGLIVFVTMALYILFTILITEWRTKFQRRMNLADNEQRARSVDSLLNFETVKYYSAEDYEVKCYEEAIRKYQKEEFSSMITLNILNTIQNVIVCVGLLAGSLLCGYIVVYHEGLTVGDYVLFASYIIQLYVPLNWFGTFYRAIQKNFVDMENMFDLLHENQDVIDPPGAPQLAVIRGGIDFSNVSFGYTPEKIVLKNITFNIPPGKTVALVGPSGAGKSTIMRLLFRFYDVDNGAIMIDGQNIKTVTQLSLRQSIGVVPQDTVLFNQTIKFNIQYGKLTAEDQDVIQAAKNADIHEKILSFPQQYETQVGERGLRLSGGEKQRVAIARTILKAPQIVLLDEATSALDTQTERNIQSALSRVCSNRTTLIIAHRLSTIIHSDLILVMKDGEIVERGRHDDLLQDHGVYADMWNQQLKNLESDKNTEEEESSSLKQRNV